MKLLSAVIVSLLVVGSSQALAGDQPVIQRAPVTTPGLDRNMMSTQIIKRWAPYAETHRGENRAAWVRGIRSTLESADLMNMKRATKATTFEGMINALMGQPMGDEAIVESDARLMESGGSVESGTGILSLGDTASDLVYTPVTPCRLADSRASGSPLANAGAVFLDSYNVGGNFTTQGGAGSDCNIPANPAAISVSVTALPFAAGGFMKIHPSNASPFQGATINFSANAGISNDVIIKSCQGCDKEFGLYSSAASHYVVDVTGYFMAPVATALDCTIPTEDRITAAGVRSFTTIFCPVGYVATGGGVSTGTNTGSFMNASGPSAGGAGQLTSWFSSVTNESGVEQTYTHYATCCRIPGR